MSSPDDETRPPSHVVRAARVLDAWVRWSMSRALSTDDPNYVFTRPAELADALRFFLQVYAPKEELPPTGDAG